MPLQSTRGSAAIANEEIGRWKVLIVEDDPELWPILERFSEAADPGVEIEFAGNASEAEERLTSGTRYNAIVTDYCLPRPGAGKAILDRATSLQPWARVGMVSALMGFEPEKGTPFLAKPFTRQTYLRFLRNLLLWPRSAQTR